MAVAGELRTVLIASAVSGVLGVLIGVGGSYVKDRNQRSGDKRAAVRLVGVEIQEDLISLNSWLPTGNLAHPRTNAWHSQQGTLARYLRDKQWNALASFYFYLDEAASRPAFRSCIPGTERAIATDALRAGDSALNELGIKYFPVKTPAVGVLRRPCQS